MSKILVKIFVNSKDLCSKKLSLKDSLNEIRKKIKYENQTNILFMNGSSPISLEDEKDITLEDILKDKNIYLKGEVLQLYNNDKYIIDVEMAKETPLKKFIEKYSENLPSEFNFLDKEQRTINKTDAIDDEEILIEDILNENKINIVSKDNNTIIKENNSDNKILINEPKQKLEHKSEIKIYINNEVKTIKKLNKDVKLIEVRKILSNIMSEKAYFTKGEIKIDDEEDFSLKEIIKEESIFIIDNYIVHKESNIEENLLNNNSSQEKSNEEFKIMSIIENGKKTKSKKINIKEPLSELRSMLELPLNASFLNNGADIDIKDETIFNISDIMKDNQIFIKREESQQYIIYLNNQILTKQNLEPSKDLASLRNLLSLQINEKAYFINAITKERINNEDEQFQLLSKISNNNNEIFMEQEVEIKKK